MTKKHFIALADCIRFYNTHSRTQFNESQIATLAEWCYQQNSNFNHQRWLNYIAGTCGPNGGKVKVSK